MRQFPLTRIDHRRATQRVKIVSGKIHVLWAGGGIQCTKHASNPADIRHAQSAGIPDLEIAAERPIAEAAYHLGKMAEGLESVNYHFTRRRVGCPARPCFGTPLLPVREPPTPARTVRSESALFLPYQAICAIPNQLTLDLLGLDPAIKLLSVSGRHRQRSVRSSMPLERAVAPPDPRETDGDRQFRRGTKGRARSGPRITLGAGPAARQSIPGAVVLRGNPDISAVEGSRCVPGRYGRLRSDRQAHRESEEDAQQTAGGAHVHRIQATTRSGTRIFPLVSGPSSSAITKLAAPTQVPISIGIAKPSP